MKLYRFLAVLCCILMLSPSAAAGSENPCYTAAVATAQAQQSLAGCESGRLLTDSSFSAGTAVCDWTAMGMAILNLPQDYDAYTQALADYVSQRYARQGTLDSVKATEFYRIALTAMALGADPTAFGTDGKVDLISDGVYQFSNLGAQGTNGWIFALITLDAKDFQQPENAVHTRQEILQQILAAQASDGSFGLAEGQSDPDITAMAVQALAPHCEDATVSTAVDAALAWLSQQQASDGTFTSYGEPSAETAAQVIIALCALGIDPDQDARFIKNGVTLTDTLARFCQSDGSYAHTTGQNSGNTLATAQVTLAQIAMWKQQTGQGRLYDFRSYTPPTSVANANPIIMYLGMGGGFLAVAVVACAVLKIVRKRRCIN